MLRPAAPGKAGSGPRPGIAPRPAPTALETAVSAAERTPGGTRPGPFAESNPFPGGDLVPAPEAKKKIPWGVIAVVGTAVLAGLTLAVLKVAG